MAVSDIMAAQALLASDPNRLFAVGKYMLMPRTLKEAVQKLSIDPSAATLTLLILLPCNRIGTGHSQ
jgi:hypothetical protein